MKETGKQLPDCLSFLIFLEYLLIITFNILQIKILKSQISIRKCLVINLPQNEYFLFNQLNFVSLFETNCYSSICSIYERWQS